MDERDFKEVSVAGKRKLKKKRALGFFFNPLRPNNDLSQTSHCNIKGVSVGEVMRIENEITPVKFC